eukprot:GFUD01007112.1.p1 GENE.GFUD01007112.1~~GFUD01007112.1.p1  ORF type:complete len:406 (+),score=142.44 GFUD01007112.1:2-1219(+)
MNLMQDIEISNIGKERVHKLKNVFEDGINNEKGDNTKHFYEDGLRQAANLSSRTSYISYMDRQDLSRSQDNIDMDDDEYDNDGDENENIRRDSVSSHDGQIIPSDDSSENEASNPDSETDVRHSKQADSEKRKTSVKNLAIRFSTISNDDKVEMGKANDANLSHIPEDLRQFFRESPQTFSGQSGEIEEDFTERFRADSSYGEISDMVSQFNKEKQGLSTAVPVEQTAGGESGTVLTNKRTSPRNRVPERLIGMFDKPNDHLGRSDGKTSEEIRSSSVSEMAQSYESNSNTNCNDDRSDTESNNEKHENYSDQVTITYDQHKSGNFEQFEYGRGEVEEMEEPDFIGNETLLSGVSFSEGESLIEEKESSDSDYDRVIARDTEFQYTTDPNYLAVKRLKSQFEKHQ